MTETPATILEWSNATFGNPPTLVIATRASKEVNELVCAVLNDAPLPAIYEEMADCAIMMWQVAGRVNIDHRPDFRQGTSREDVLKDISAIRIQRRFTSVLEELSKTKNPGHQFNASFSQLHTAGILRDSLLCLEYLAWAYDIDLQEHVDAKMVINRARQWKQGQCGDYQHVAVAAVA